MDDFNLILKASESAAERQMVNQCLGGHDRDRGGIQDPNTLYTDVRGSMYVCNLWLTLYLCEESKFHDDEAMADRIVRLLDFMLRRQHPDGTIDLGNWRHAPCEVGFTLIAACHNHKKLLTADVLQKKKIAEMLGRYIENGGRAVREGQMYTANHRWTPGVAALACVNEIFPHPGNIEKIEDYLDDGIDCTHEGIYYIERSPNYNMVADYGLLLAAEKLNRPELLRHVRRNLDFCLHMINPSGYAESGLSFRQDRGRPDARFGSYSVYKMMAVKDNNGVWAQAADELLQEIANGNGGWSDIQPALQIFDRPGMRDETIARQPLPTDFHKYYVNGELARIRHDNVAVTVKGNGKPYQPTGWGGPVGEANFLAVYNGKAAVENIMVKFGYNPDQAFKPEHIEPTGNGYALSYHHTGHALRMEHRRHGRRDMWMHADFTVNASVRIADDAVGLHIDADGLQHVPVVIEMLLDPQGELLIDGRDVELASGEIVWFEGREAKYTRGAHSIIIRPGLCEHRYPLQDTQIVTGNAEERCARLAIAGYAPFEHAVEFICA